MNVINWLTNIYISSSKSIEFLAMTRLSGTLIKRTRFTNPFGPSLYRCSTVTSIGCQGIVWSLRTSSLLCQSWPLYTNSTAKKRHFSRSLSLLSSYDLKKDPDRFLCPSVDWTLKSLNVEKILAVKDATYSVAERKPDKNEEFRLAARDSNPDLCDTGAVL